MCKSSFEPTYKSYLFKTAAKYSYCAV